MRGVRTHRNTIRLALVVLGTLLLAALSAARAWAATPSGGGGSGPSGGTGPSGTSSSPSKAGALGRTGMWIWYVSRSNGGNLSSIVATAHKHAVGTVIVKSGDGSGYWSQFSSRLVSTLHRGGLRVCAWQYVYGSHPVMEAEVGARAAQTGADCLLIDAEGEYEGRYAAAQAYLSKLRSLVGSSYPVALATFPYVDYHPGFPYSVFLGPGGAQYNVPQMYWHDIGATVDDVYSHTYFYNAPYNRPIAPLGEVTGNPPPSAIKRFRQLRRVYHAPATSWWDWQEASSQSWGALSATIANAVGTAAKSGMPMLGIRGKGVIKQGDLVVWAQEHLWSAGNRVKIDGVFGTGTRTAVRQYQSTHRLTVTGQVNAATWASLLHYSAAAVTWTTSGATVARGASDSGGTRGGSSPVFAPPRSARLKARVYEIPAHLGQG